MPENKTASCFDTHEILPVHIAIIMDGNGRWAKARGKTRSEGHRAGSEAAREIVAKSKKLGIKYLTLYSFSKENWLRPKTEITFLFGLLKSFLKNELAFLQKENIRLNVLGNIEELPMATRKALLYTCNKTESNSSMQLNLALNYSGREELARAVREIIKLGTSPEECTAELIGQHLYTRGQPDPDLIIRTSGECRLSNFLLFQCAYSELYFTNVLWPDFSPEELCKALTSFAQRKRRFGKVDTEADPVGNSFYLP